MPLYDSVRVVAFEVPFSPEFKAALNVAYDVAERRPTWRLYLLSLLYTARALTVLAFLAAPKTELTFLLFSAAIGVTYLSTVPATGNLVAKLFGLRNMATLFGLVFLSHQVGGFLGAWLGGLLYDRTGSYDVVWWISIGLGVAAGLLNLPIDERAVRRPEAKPA